MNVRSKLALTVVATGLLTALGVILTVVLAFARFEHESAYDRANTFLSRVLQNYDNILELQERRPEEFEAWLRNLVLFEADTQLYLLSADGTVLASTGSAQLPRGFKVALGPVKEAAASAEGGTRRPYVMGDDPEHMSTDAVIAARALRRATIRQTEPVAGYLYLVCHKPPLPPGRLQVFRSSFAGPALAVVSLVVLLTTLLAWWVTAAVVRPLRRLSDDVAQVARDGLGVEASQEPLPTLGEAAATQVRGRHDEFGQLSLGFGRMLATLRLQWQALRRLDHFRREGVSNLSHDLRSPLTATVACLETLEQRWAQQSERSEDRQLVAVALRNTRNAAQMVRSLGDLAQLDEPEFKLHTEVLDVGELLGDICMRFAQRAAQQQVTLAFQEANQETPDTPAPFAALDIELFERAVANVVDNALKFAPAGASVVLSAKVLARDPSPAPHPNFTDWQWVRVSISDTGPGIAAADLPHLFDRFYQSRHNVAPASSSEGKGLGLAIVKRIVELHQGHVEVSSTLGQGTRVDLFVPFAGTV
ncbi:MAG: ATP-binding protein [Burkholderiales bacterium]